MQRASSTSSDQATHRDIVLAALAVLLVTAGTTTASTVTIVPLPSDAEKPVAVGVDEDGLVWVTLDGTWALARHNPASNETRVVPLAAPKGDQEYALTALAFAPDGSIWMNSLTHLHRVDPVSLNATAQELPQRYVLPGDVHVTPDGSVWASMVVENVLLRHEPGTDGVATLPVAPETEGSGLTGPLMFTSRPDGLYFTTTYAGSYARLDPDTGTVTHGPRDIFRAPVGLADDGTNFWVGEHGANTVARHQPDANVTERFPTTTGTSPITGPNDVLVARDGSVWFAEHFGNRLGRLDPVNRTLHEFELGTTYVGAQHVAEAPDGSVWTALWAEDTLARVTFDGGAPGFELPERVTVPRGGSTSIPFDASAQIVTGSPVDELEVTHENGDLVVTASEAAPLGDHNVVVSEREGVVRAGRYMVVTVEEEGADDIPGSTALISFAAVVLATFLARSPLRRRHRVGRG